jgi:RNA polymerase sigma-70 factor (ECF subfamily)
MSVNMPVSGTENVAALADEDLIALVQQGDEAAFTALVARHRAAVRGCVLRYVSRLEDAEDVAQETWLAVHSHLAQFRGECGFRTWLWRIAQNQSLLHLRRARTSAVDLAESSLDGRDFLSEVLPSHADTPEEVAVEQEAQRLALTAVRQLKPSYRRPLYLWAVEGRSLAEIAKLTGVSYMAVKMTLFRARQAAQAELRRLMWPRGTRVQQLVQHLPSFDALAVEQDAA